MPMGVNSEQGFGHIPVNNRVNLVWGFAKNPKLDFKCITDDKFPHLATFFLQAGLVAGY